MSLEGEKTARKLTGKNSRPEEIENHQYFAPKYQKEEIEKLLELADHDEGVSFTYTGKLKETQIIDEDLKGSVHNETQPAEPLQAKTELTSSNRDEQSDKVEEKPVPAPRRFFLSDHKTRELESENVSNVRARTFSHVTSYYHQGLPPAIGKIS